MEYHTIKKIAFYDKYMELWLEELPFTKVSLWDEETQTSIETDEDQYNSSTKPHYFADAFRATCPEIDIDDLIHMNGWKVFYGFRIAFENTHPVSLMLPIELETKALKSLL